MHLNMPNVVSLVFKLQVIVEDDGIGFDTDSVTEKGYGLKAIKKKVVNNLRGSISIDSGKRGTVIIIKTTLNP